MAGGGGVARGVGGVRDKNRSNIFFSFDRSTQIFDDHSKHWYTQLQHTKSVFTALAHTKNRHTNYNTVTSHRY